MESQGISFTTEHPDQIRCSDVKAKYSVSGYILRFYVDMWHKGLALHKEVSAPEIDILQIKVQDLIAGWDAKYRKAQSVWGIQKNQQLADQATTDEEEKRRLLLGILKHTLSIDDAIEWSVLKDRTGFKRQRFKDDVEFDGKKPFTEMKPLRPGDPPAVVFPLPTLVQKLTGRARRMREEYQDALRKRANEIRGIDYEHNRSIALWVATKEAHDKAEEEREREFNAAREARKAAFHKEQDQAEAEYIARQNTLNAKIDDLRERWENADPQAIEEHASIVLDHSNYHDLVEIDFELAYDADQKLMMVQYKLPSLENMPIVKTYRFEKRTGEIKKTALSQKDQRELFEGVYYQICLRTIHELFESDVHDNFEKVAFNGITRYVDKATGKEVEATILSVVADRRAFLELNLANVDPKACFKSLKGVSAASLVGLTPVVPIIQFDKSDKRFIEGKDILAQVETRTNLAAMDWEEFEHLVRELFEKEFLARGGEVCVTQSSSDGGVDAVAFDPDPISGGKIVIQAKRYTNTVSVSAVRDLYGTTMNEGAIKGILVTTSDFGPDAYKFASDKPLTLMSGAELLHLLEKHGVKATIDIRDARKDLGLRTS